jgi:sugar lactone lactonase YvrE
MHTKLQYILSLILIICSPQIIKAQKIDLVNVATYESDFLYPTDICGNDQGDVFVLDAMNDRVVNISSSGQVKIIQPQRGTIYKAVGIAWISDQLWIADTPRSRLLRMDEKGRISQVIELDRGSEPVDLIGISGYMAISDRLNHSITVLDEQGKEKFYWGKRGSKIGEFINPGFLAVGPENRLLVSDILNRRVLSFSASGRFPQIIAKPGVEEGQVFRPKGLGLDSESQVWIADGYTGSLQAFSISGKYLGLAAAEGKALQLSSPIGMWIDEKDQIWVVESTANKVSVWQKNAK